LRFATISLGSGGLPSCARCTPPGSVDQRTGWAVIAEALAIIESWDRAALGPGPNLSFGGAEPFSHAELPRIITTAAEAGASRLRLTTSAEALSVPGNAAGVVHAGVRHLEIQLLGDGVGHDDLTGRRGAFAAMVRGARGFSEAAGAQGAAVALTGRVVVCRHNLESVPAAVAALAELGAREVVLEVGDEAAASVDAGRWLVSACETGVVNGTWVSVRSSRPLATIPELHRFAVCTPMRSSSASDRKA
jgi:MoaA/NifB/PqqE/SkfB family radical SAM enzyme